ncbi:hypothetical protein A2767_04900 [Candidatus Roizmanbacteria bacterium RIFCSPHIGHO2_01_FULL_35_10]|uniref:Mannosyl-glycoprotein endo-beta-N-acetylglucosamidase-like domain-containing protein n=1 Tax=Candidatus Roizmanbacteria bacterium RIFCSPLOWO2_01_FULL_35_13 TaxID=1802055 RepID=A0A1F7I757_9BACT|nr:MAG: hypothetical protein A2767_04900 [Candidatus Roizmanbacteria bacterium RIFCSPHIGHO2_01_FULL_35_10]OGK39207.1 MAG: hypothetical protein A3A74_07645 [Candidatus Roizmanbacteria bacterium RIFCSPLOWO2_01_FULL_35_13]
MLKKVGFYLISFILVLLFNFYIQSRIIEKTNHVIAMNKTLEEIENDNNTAGQFNFSSAPFETGPFKTEIKTSDGRAANLKIFFRRHGSVLYDFAEKIVKESDRNGFDYRLLPAIAMQESTLCKAIPVDSHNCWGWGIYGTTVTRFDSYDDAIETVAKGIKENYIDEGLTTATKIMARYTPSSSTWAFGVNTFLKALE